MTGNGSTKFHINQLDMGGWVRVFLGSGTPPPDLGVYLSHSLTDFFRQRPQLRCRLVVPISRDGDTVELHAWYDAVIFPDTSGLTPKQPAID